MQQQLEIADSVSHYLCTRISAHVLVQAGNLRTPYLVMHLFAVLTRPFALVLLHCSTVGANVQVPV
jgi:hypothetical protein